MTLAIARRDERSDVVADLFDSPGLRGPPAQIPRRQILARTGCQ
jgi:hypothetical protein